MSAGAAGPTRTDLELAWALADAADLVSLAAFRSEALRTSTKGDGTPVSEVDLAVEQAMHALVRAERPGDAVIGEEIGPHDGTDDTGGTARRWIFDGIDGTHNYSIGRDGWTTIIALERDGEVVLGLLSAPRFGWRWWAVRGEGAWSAEYRDASCSRADARALRCSTTAVLADASVIATPFQGFIVGWRSEAARRFVPPETPRGQCFGIDAVMVATGALDATLILFGGLWDFAATSCIVEEAGGTFHDVWGTHRFDTQSGLYANATLAPQVLAAVADLRPAEPDRAVAARTVSRAISADPAADEWMRFGLRPLPSMSARHRVTVASPVILDVVDERAAELTRPFVGVTTDGIVRPLHNTSGTDRTDDTADTRPIGDAALVLLQALTPEQRTRLLHPIDAIEWRQWINVHMNHFRHGLLLEDLGPATRELALDLLRVTLSTRGYEQARAIMRINELLARLGGDHDAFGEWPYFLSLFGEPGGDAPWGWQIDGHHLCVNVMVFADRIVATPAFMGAEPRAVRSGELAGTSLFDPEEAGGLDLLRSLDARQRGRAVIHPSILTDQISPELQNIFDGRMQAGAFHDNLVAPYQGIDGASLTDAQRRLLARLLGAYTGWTAGPYSSRRQREVERHLDDTWFSWYGGFDDVAPFYYRVHSPVILVEFDHHPGVVLDNEEPTRHHVHTVVRTPNGGDYGTDLLREHHERFAHRDGHHHSR